jgi:uncharacterized cupredoxin-like copper-binding protein
MDFLQARGPYVPALFDIMASCGYPVQAGDNTTMMCNSIETNAPHSFDDATDEALQERHLNLSIHQRLLPTLCALLLIACGPGNSAPSGVRVAASEFRFEPASLTIKANVATTLTFKNAGQTLHDLTIVSGPGIPTPAAGAMDHMQDNRLYHVAAEAGKEATLALNLPAGSYTFICSVQGHKELGMQGTINVQ